MAIVTLFQVREVYKSKSNIVILDCSKEKLVEVLKQAQQVSIVSETYFYLLTSLDSHTVDLEPFTVSMENKIMIVVIVKKINIKMCILWSEQWQGMNCMYNISAWRYKLYGIQNYRYKPTRGKRCCYANREKTTRSSSTSSIGGTYSIYINYGRISWSLNDYSECQFEMYLICFYFDSICIYRTERWTLPLLSYMML